MNEEKQKASLPGKLLLRGKGAARLLYARVRPLLHHVRHPIDTFYREASNGRRDWMPDWLYIRLMYRAKLGRWPHLFHPRRYSEKLNWLKLHDHREEYHALADKCGAKRIVAEAIGKEHVIPALGVYERFEDVDFSTLPDQFVMKCTHDSGSILICRDKASFDFDKAREHFDKALAREYYKTKREWCYKGLHPRLLIEEYVPELSSPENEEYRVACNYGKMCYLIVSGGPAHTEEFVTDYYDRDLNHLPLVSGYNVSKKPIALPEQLPEIIRLSEQLCGKDKPHARVDWYLVKGRLYFGEMTFYIGGGFPPFEPDKYDFVFGEWLDLAPVKARLKG